MTLATPPPAPHAPTTGWKWPAGPRIVVLVSGRGSNLQALIDTGCPIAEVVSNVPRAPALERARTAGIPAGTLDHRRFRSRAEFDDALAARVDGPGRANLVVLAGFMRILGPAFTQRFAGRLINVHPSVLPALPGLHTHRRALEARVREHGCTVHFVTEALDAGPIIERARIEVRPDDSPESLAARVLVEEHRILPRAIHRFATGRLRLRDGKAWLDGRPIQPG